MHGQGFTLNVCRRNRFWLLLSPVCICCVLGLLPVFLRCSSDCDTGLRTVSFGEHLNI